MNIIRHIKVCGEFLSTGLWDEKTYLMINPKELNLPEELVKRLNQLVADYGPIIPMMDDQLETPEVQARIRAIDARGLALTRDIAQFLGDKFRLRYFSEYGRVDPMTGQEDHF